MKKLVVESFLGTRVKVKCSDNDEYIGILEKGTRYEEEYAQAQLNLIIQKSIDLQRYMDNMRWSERCNLLSEGEICSEEEVNRNYRRLKYALGAVFIPLIILSAQLNLDPAECFDLAINDLEKSDIEG